LGTTAEPRQVSWKKLAIVLAIAAVAVMVVVLVRRA